MTMLAHSRIFQSHQQGLTITAHLDITFGCDQDVSVAYIPSIDQYGLKTDFSGTLASEEVSHLPGINTQVEIQSPPL